MLVRHGLILPLPNAPRVPAIYSMDDGAWQALSTAERENVQRAASHARKEKKAADRLRCSLRQPNVIVDLAYDELMSDRQIASLAQQLLFCHRASKKSVLTHCLSSYGGRLETRLAGVHGSNAWPVARHRCSYLDVASQYLDCDVTRGHDKLIYLTAEGDETLTSVDTECIYVIGGLVDRNRHKGLTHRRAQAAGLRTARLPLAEHASLSRDGESRALTVNHCFEMLALRAQGYSWPTSIAASLPPRRRGDSE